MSIIQDVQNAIADVSDSINNIQTIAEAIRTGRDYLKTQHPNVATDLATMCEEMRKSSQALAAASSIVTHFRFVTGSSAGPIQANEAARFNEHLVRHKSQADALEAQLDSMRGHCSIIAKHAEKIREEAIPTGLTSLAAALGLHSAEKEEELADALSQIHNEELQYHTGVNAMAFAVKTTLGDVQNALGPAGMIDPANVPTAAALLGEYATAFAELEARCNHNALELQASIDALQTGP
ncbi:MAG: hypothetical protein AAFY59_05555 [Pseudomonadota bacterium]